MGEEVSEVDDFDEIELLLDKIPSLFQWNNQKTEESKGALVDSWCSSLSSEPPMPEAYTSHTTQLQWMPHLADEDDSSTLTHSFSDLRIVNGGSSVQIYTSFVEPSQISSQNSCSGSSDMDPYTEAWDRAGLRGRMEEGCSENHHPHDFESIHRSNSRSEHWPHYFSLYGFRNLPYSAITECITLNRVEKQPLPWFDLHRSDRGALSCGNFSAESQMGHVAFLLRRLRTEGGHPDICYLDSLDGLEMCMLAKDQQGCRLLQGVFAEGMRDDMKRPFLKIVDHILELITDPYGNYLVQKLIDVSMEWQITRILFMVARYPVDLVTISCNIHGTRVVQRLIEALTTSEQFVMMASALRPCMVTLFKNQNGSHVATCFLRFMRPQYTGFLFEVATINCVEVATNQHGCCVIQKLLNHYKEDQSHSLFHQISSNALLLSQHQYGNYAVQYVLFLRIAWATMDVIQRLYGNYGSLSTQKYSSNVVEKCLLYGDEVFQLEIVHELLDYPRFSDILQDQYGNYVIQSALKFSKGKAYNVMVKAIKPYAHTLRAYPFGKKILSICGIKR